MRAEVEIIDPAYAKQLLEQNCRNRNLSQSAVERYASDMREDRWNNNGQGIVLTADGKLLDGQHRMAAVIRAQKPVAMLVVRGVPEDTFGTMDSGRPRSLSDVLAIEGIQNVQLVSGMARQSWVYASNVTQSNSATKTLLQRFVHDHPYFQEAAKLLTRGPLIVPKVPCGAVLFLANENRQYDKEIVEFVDAIYSGSGLFKGDPRLTLREWIISARQRHALPHSRLVFGACARAWNAFAQGRELTAIRAIDAPSRTSIPIVGFDLALYPGVRDLALNRIEVARRLGRMRSNLPDGEVTMPLQAADAAG